VTRQKTSRETKVGSRGRRYRELTSDGGTDPASTLRTSGERPRRRRWHVSYMEGPKIYQKEKQGTVNQ